MSGYTKLFASILDSTVWLTDPNVRLVWITMLAMADQDGRVEASVPGLAIRARVSRAECEDAISVLSSPDPDSRSPEAEGRRIVKIDGGWELVNHAKYRQRMDADERRGRDAERKRRKRASMSADASANVRGCPPVSIDVPNVSHAEAEAEAEQGEPEPPPAVRRPQEPLSDRKTQLAAAAVIRQRIEKGAREAKVAVPRECAYPDDRTWWDLARKSIDFADARSVSVSDVLELLTEQILDDMPRRAWKVRHLVEDFNEFVLREHIERRERARAKGAA